MVSIRALLRKTALFAAYAATPNFFLPAFAGADSQSISASEVPGLIHIPITRQATSYTCGAAALASVLHWIDPSLDFTEDMLSRQLKSSSKHGTKIRNIDRLATSKGLSVSWRDGWTMEDLEKSLHMGRPVIVLIQAYAKAEVVGSVSDWKFDWKNDWKDGHYVVVNGIDTNNIYMMDPSSRGAYTYIPRQEFLDRWHDVDVESRHVHFGMTISDPRKTGVSAYDRDEITRLR